MTAPIRLRLDQATRADLSERYEHTRGAVERTNCQIILLADKGRHAPEIAWLVRRGVDQVRKVLHRFQSEGLAGLARRKAPGRTLQITPAWLAELQRVIDLEPRSVGVPGVVWGDWPSLKLSPNRLASGLFMIPFEDMQRLLTEDGEFLAALETA